MHNSPHREIRDNHKESKFGIYWNTFLDLIFPVNCRTCFKKLDGSFVNYGYICEECWNKVDYIRPPYCLKCGHPSGDGFQDFCDECKILKPVYFNQSRAVAKYTDPLRKAIHFWKYQYKEDLSKSLSDLMFRYVQTSKDLPEVDFIVPVPLHPRKLQIREFNQSEILSEPIARYLKIPVLPHLLFRTRYTRPQVGLTANERFDNVSGLFHIDNRSLVHDRKILLVDDVMTTGATINECSRVLHESGAKEIYVLTLARGQ